MKNIKQIGIPVKDVDRAIHFYKDLLGLSLLFNTDSMAFFNCNGIRLMLSLPEKREFAQASSVIYFEVDDIQESYADLTEKGIPFIDEPHRITKMENTETWMVFFKDSEDNTHALTSETITH
ncbi:VOC family protein [Virgibacillus necropolis]|uniref:Glyoxalase n=1 Tax=Virgibacillus necropolis TaxID=163877 RepID=A0A221M8H0_9BACI|nr:VOC family protein [Virgibacillus necropolis]ASN03937.1 glyoxalase [Virgibacillus necropolis]